METAVETAVKNRYKWGGEGARVLLTGRFWIKKFLIKKLSGWNPNFLATLADGEESTIPMTGNYK